MEKENNKPYIPGIDRNSVNKNKSTGIRGVNYCKDQNKYRAYIRFQRKTIELGYYDTLEEAAKVRKRQRKNTFKNSGRVKKLRTIRFAAV